MGAVAGVGLVVMRAALAATITVGSAGDTVATDGAVTLREALASIARGADVDADVAAHRDGSYGAADEVAFAIGSGAVTIAPASPLPRLYRPLRLDGTTQPGFTKI
jgi:hypothetical protein